MKKPDDGVDAAIIDSGAGGRLIAPIVPLDAALRTDVALKKIHRVLLQRITANEASVRDALAGEYLHDFRVAVRRTRTGLRQLKCVYPREASQRFAADFAWLSANTSVARDLEVFIASLDIYHADLDTDTVDGLQPLVGFLRDHQRTERTLCTSTIESARYKSLISNWVAFLRSPPDPGGTARDAARPVREVGAERIDKAYARVVRRGVDLDETSPAARFHRLRLDCKKLRYLLEFFGALFEGEEGAGTVATLRATQDSLGAINDLRVQREWLERFALRRAVDRFNGCSLRLPRGPPEGGASGVSRALRAVHQRRQPGGATTVPARSRNGLACASQRVAKRAGAKRVRTRRAPVRGGQAQGATQPTRAVHSVLCQEPGRERNSSCEFTASSPVPGRRRS